LRISSETISKKTSGGNLSRFPLTHQTPAAWWKEICAKRVAPISAQEGWASSLPRRDE